MEDPMAQKILKALDEHGEALKRMGGHLTRLEESKLKKPPHVEIHDDEKEDEEWMWNMKGTSNLISLPQKPWLWWKDGENETRLLQGTRDGWLPL